MSSHLKSAHVERRPGTKGVVEKQKRNRFALHRIAERRFFEDAGVVDESL
jgi:hypothetical protein